MSSRRSLDVIISCSLDHRFNREEGLWRNIRSVSRRNPGIEQRDRNHPKCGSWPKTEMSERASFKAAVVFACCCCCCCCCSKRRCLNLWFSVLLVNKAAAAAEATDGHVKSWLFEDDAGGWWAYPCLTTDHHILLRRRRRRRRTGVPSNSCNSKMLLSLFAVAKNNWRRRW